MPDVLLTNTPLPPTGNNGLLPAYEAAPAQTGASIFQKGLADVAKMQQKNNINALMNIPVATPLNDVLRYTDPNIGFNPFDSRLEYKYADAHPVATFRNNLVQFGGRFLGAATEAIATIPLAINAAAKKDFSKLYDNELSNDINDWLNNMQNAFPVYQSEYEHDHPLLKFLTPWNFKSFTGAWGGAVNNLGFTVGAIAGAMVEDVAITALTGGAGLLPALAANGAQLTKGLSKAAKIMIAAPEDAMAITRSVYQGTKLLGEGAAGVAEGAQIIRGTDVALGGGSNAVIRGEGTGLFQSAGRLEDVLAAKNARNVILDRANTYYKIRDAVKYNLALLTSATAEGTFEASEVYNRGKDELSRQFFDVWGRAPQGDEVREIDRQAKEAGNFTMGANIALLYLSNRLNWGSLFKPTGQAMREFEGGITGFGKSVARTSAKGELDQTGKVVYSVLNKAPESRIGRILLSGEKLGRIGFRSVNEAIEEGSQFIVSEGSMDYIKKKYDPNNLAHVADFMKSFNVGLGKTLGTNEGWDNIIGGFVGGILGGGIINKVQKELPINQRLQNQVSLLNRYNFNGTLENRFQEAAVQTGLAADHKTAVESNDVYKAKNIKFDMLYNWVASGVRANGFEKRMQELDMVRDLEGKSFTSYWGVADTAQNREAVNNFLDGVKEKAEKIRKNVEKVEYLTKNPHKQGTVDHVAYEQYKDELSLNLSRYEEYQRRLAVVQSDLKTTMPMLDIKQAVKMTSVQGISEILKKLNETNTNIAKQITLAQGNEDIVRDLTQKKKALDSIYKRLQTIVYSGTTTEGGRTSDVQFNGKDYVSAMRDLFDLHNGIDYESNRYLDNQKQIGEGNTIYVDSTNERQLNDDELADNLEKLQDVYKLSDANYNIGKYYTYLRKGLGETAFTTAVKNILAQNQKFRDDDGGIKTPQNIEDDIRAQEYADIAVDETDEETTSEEREILKKAAKKTANNENLTEDEEKVAEKNENVFTKYVKAEQNIKAKVEKVVAPETVEVVPTTIESLHNHLVTEPRNLFGMFSQDKNDVKFRTNLYNAIFNSPVGQILANVKATFKQVEVNPDAETITKIPNSKIFRSSFDENITITHNGNQVGILRPANSMWLDDQKKRSIYDMTEDEYVDVTGNPKGTYAQFMAEIKAYKNAYNALKEDLKANPNKEFDINEIQKHFKLSINLGSRVQNKVDESEKDTVLKNLKYKPKGTALVSLNEVVAVNKDKKQVSSKTINPHVVNAEELSKEQLAKLNKFIEENLDLLRANANRYALILPINGEYKKGSIVFGRNAETEQTEREEYYNAIRDVAAGLTRGEDLDQLINDLYAKFFVANIDRTIKQTFITTSFNQDGDLVMIINNPSLKVYKSIVIDKAVVLNTNSYGELMGKIQSEIINESSKDKGLADLKIVIDEKSLKRQIPADEKITKLSQVENVIKVNTIPNVFENYGINFTPNIGGQQTASKPNSPTAPKPNSPNTLPVNLQGAKPRYGYGNTLYELNFRDDITKAAYIVSQKTKSKRDAEYLKFLMDATGMTEAEARAYGLQIRANIKSQIESKDNIENGTFGNTVNVNSIYTKEQNKQPIVTETPKTKAQYAKAKAGVVELLKKYFGLNEEQAQANAEVFDKMAQAYAKRTGNSKISFYNKYGFAKSTLADLQDDEVLKQHVTDVQKIIQGFNLVPKYAGSQFVGFTTTNNNASKNLVAAAQKWIDDNKLNAVAYGDKTHGTIFIRPKVGQGNLFQLVGEQGARNNNELIAKLAQANQLEKEFGLDKIGPYWRNLKTDESANTVDERLEYEAAKKIFLATGWMRGVDGKWRTETSDKNTLDLKKFKTNTGDDKISQARLVNVLDDEELYKLYPLLQNAIVIVDPKTKQGEGSFGKISYKNVITIGGDIHSQDFDLELAHSVLRHEIQHYVQQEEGFARGGNPQAAKNQQSVKDRIAQAQKERDELWELIDGKAEFLERYKEMYGENDTYKTQEERYQALVNKLVEFNKKYPNGIVNTEAFNYYQSLVGEVEARNVQFRQQLTDEERKQIPIVDTEDIDRESQNIIGNVLLQEGNAAFNKITHIIYALENPNVSSPVHEFAHAWEEYLTEEEKKTIQDFAKTGTWTRETSEAFARGFEQYLLEGKAPSPKMQTLFDKFAKWLAEIYNDFKAAFGLELNDDMRKIYATMLNSEFVKEETKKEIESAINKVTTSTTTENGEVYTTVIENNGKTVGEIKAINDGSTLTVTKAEVSTPRRGIGVEAYRQLAKEAVTLGLTLQSDTFDRLSPEAKGLWEKLVANGEAIKGADNYVFQSEVKEAKKADTERRRQELGLQTVKGLFEPSQGSNYFRIILKGDKFDVLAFFDGGQWSIFPKQPNGEFQASDPKTGNALILNPKQRKEVVEKYAPKELIDLLEAADRVKGIAEQDKFMEGRIKTYLDLYEEEILRYNLDQAEQSLAIYESPNYPNKDSQDRIVKAQKKEIAEIKSKLAKYDAELKALKQQDAEVSNQSKIEAKKEKKAKAVKKEKVEDVFEPMEGEVAATLKTVKVKENPEQSAKQDTTVFTVTYNGKVLGDVLEDIPEAPASKYSIVGDDINGYKVLDGRKEVKNAHDVELEKQIKQAIKEDNQAKVDKLKAELNGDYITREDAQNAIDELETLNQESNGWYNTKGEFLGDTKNEAVQALIDKYNEDNNLKPAEKVEREFIHIKVKGQDIVGEVTQIDGKLYTVVTKNGNVYTKAISQARNIKPATEEEFNAQAEIEKPTPKYEQNARVKTNSGEHVLTGVDIRQIPNTTDYEIFYETESGAVIPETGITGRVRESQAQSLNKVRAEHLNREITLRNIAAKFGALFPQIKYEIGDFNVYDENGKFIKHQFDAPARFYNGVVQVNVAYSDKTYSREEIAFHEANDPFNVPWLKRETVAHEFMHPFILAMKMSNEALYNSLVNELHDKHQDIIAHVNKLVDSGNYQEENKNDEALAIYLGRELTKAFTKNGKVDMAYVANRNLLQKFVSWLNDIIDYLTGKKKPKSLEQFVQDANANKAGQKDFLQAYINRHPAIKEFVSKDNNLTKKVAKLVREKEAVKAITTEEEFDQLYEILDNYKNGVNIGISRFEFIVRENDKHFVEFDETDEDNIKVYVDPQVAEETTLANTLLQYGNRLTNEDHVSEYQKLVKDNFYQPSKKHEAEKVLNVKSLNPLMKLQDVSDFVLLQLSNGQEVKIEYTKDELGAIDELEAYMELEKPQAEKIRKRILAKLAILKETADKRLNSDTLKLNYNIINKLNLDNNDVDFVLKYIQQASISINAAWRKYNQLRQDIDANKGNVSKAELTRLNKELNIIRQLVGFYDEFSNYARFEESFDDAEVQKFNKTMRSLGFLRESMANTAIDLTVEWFMPYAEQHNKYIKKEGYNDDKYLITADKLYEFFKYGTGRDTNFITFWLGSNITSRDPINASFANTVSDMLTANNIEIVNKSFDVNEGFDKFLKDKGISVLNGKAQVDYYNKHYLRDAETLIFKQNPNTGELEEEYIKKKALHQEFFFDKYEKDLNEERKKYKNPRNSEEADLFQEKLEAWKQSKNYGKSNEYRNPDYDKIKNDEYFKTLEKYYNESNIKYGQNALKFGIIPQQYSVNLIQKAKRLVDDLKSNDTTISQKLKDQGYAARVGLAGIQKDNRNLNLDGSIYREVNSTLTNFKKEENISHDLHSLMVDFITEATNYSSLKETQYQAETLSMLLEGNVKFGIQPRRFAQENFAKKITQPRQLEEAKAELQRLQDLKDDGKPYDEKAYKYLTEKIAKGLQDKNLWDDFLQVLKPARTNYNNDMLLGQLNDVYFGESTEEQKIGNVSANKLAHYLSLYTSVNNMAFNRIAAIGNINIGNLQLFIEGHGGKYFTKADVAKALADYLKNLPDFIKDIQSPIKSKDTQLSFLLDAIQGEVQDEFGVRVTGNIAKKMFRTNSLFLLTSLGEHQIQITGMKAMMLGRKVKTQDGKTITLYDAFVKNKEGRYELRTDLKDFDKEDLAKFIRDLHGVNRALNGNYSELNKTMLARKWFGTLLLKFRKYLYPAFRSRFVSEHTDYERNTVEVGYLRYFFQHMLGGLKNLNDRVHSREITKTPLKPHEKYAIRKAQAEVAVYVALTLIGMGIASGGDDKKKKLSDAEKYALLFVVRLRSDLGMYHVNMPSEAVRQVKSPTASLTTVVAAFNAFGQLINNPTEVYDKKSGTHEEGDSKLRAKFEKLIPILNKLEINVDDKLGYYNLINRNIEGVSAKNNLP